MANVRNKIDVRKVISNLQDLKLDSVFVRQLETRLAELREDPYLLKQVAGCCGFNVIVTILLIHGDTAIFTSMLKKALGGGANEHEGFDKADARMKRFYPGATSAPLPGEKTNTHPVDAKISLGLVRYFRQHCGDVLWEACENYSQCWDWSKGIKLSEQGPSTMYHYKKGDLALTYDAMVWLFSDMDKGFKLEIDREVNLTKDKANAAIDRARSWARGWFTAITGRYIIAAVNTNGWGGYRSNPKLAPYDYVNHWVVVPRVRNDEGMHRQLATWGDRKNDDQLAVLKVCRVVYTKT